MGRHDPSFGVCGRARVENVQRRRAKCSEAVEARDGDSFPWIAANDATAGGSHVESPELARISGNLGNVPELMGIVVDANPRRALVVGAEETVAGIEGTDDEH